MNRRIITVFLSFSVLISLVGCGSSDLTEETVVQVRETETESETEIETETETEEDSFVTQEFEFYSDNEHLILYNFPESYKIGGKDYAISEEDVDYETLGTRDTVQMMVEMNVEELEEIPDSYSYKSTSGKTYDLENEQVYVAEKGLVKIPVIEEIFYEDQVGKPTIPSKKSITYYDKKSGEDKKIEGLLTSFTESTAGHWEDILEIEGTFMAPSESCNVYELSGAPNVTVSRAAATPVWPGYEQHILTSMGLSRDYFRITGAAWNGEQYLQDGYVMRNALFLGDMFVATYKATYEAEREAQGYATKVFYRADAEDVDAKEEDITTVYHIKAIVKYKLME